MYTELHLEKPNVLIKVNLMDIISYCVIQLKVINGWLKMG